MGEEDDQIDALQEAGRVQPVDAEEWRAGARDEDAGLVEKVVGRIEGAEVFERRGVEWKQ